MDWSLLRPGGLLEWSGPSTAFDRVPGKAHRPFRISYGLGRPAGVLHLDHGRGQPRARLVGRTRPEVSDQEHLRYGQIRQRERIRAYRKSTVPWYGLAGILTGFSRTLPMLSSAVPKCVAYSRTRRAPGGLGVLGAAKVSAATGDVGRR